MFKIWKIFATVIKYLFLPLEFVISHLINPLLIQHVKRLTKYQTVSKHNLNHVGNMHINGNMFSDYYELNLPFKKLKCVVDELPNGFKTQYGNNVGLFLHTEAGTKWNRAYREVAFFAHGEFEHWCENNCTGKWGRISDHASYRYFFEKSEDAALFKLFFIEHIEQE